MNVRPSQLYSALLLLHNIYCSFKIWSVHFMFTMNADTRGVTCGRLWSAGPLVVLPAVSAISSGSDGVCWIYRT